MRLPCAASQDGLQILEVYSIIILEANHTQRLGVLFIWRVLLE